MLPASHIRISPQFFVAARPHQNLQLETKLVLQEIIPRILAMPCIPQKKSGQLPEPSNSPRNWENWKTYQNRTFWGKWREYGRNQRKYERLGKSLQERASLNTISWDFPKGRNYSRGIGDTLHFSKTKVSSSQNHPTRSETATNEKPIKTERFEGNEGNMGEIRGNMKG